MGDRQPGVGLGGLKRSVVWTHSKGCQPCREQEVSEAAAGLPESK